MSYHIKTNNQMENSKEITLDNIIAIEVELFGNQLKTDIDFGAITLYNGKKNYIFDVTQTYRTYNEITDETEIRIDVEIDKETFQGREYNFALKDMDLLKIDTHGTIYLAMDNMDLFKDAFIYLKIKFTEKKLRLRIE